jgi:hypothetical protein
MRFVMAASAQAHASPTHKLLVFLSGSAGDSCATHKAKTPQQSPRTRAARVGYYIAANTQGYKRYNNQHLLLTNAATDGIVNLPPHDPTAQANKRGRKIKQAKNMRVRTGAAVTPFNFTYSYRIIFEK